MMTAMTAAVEMNHLTAAAAAKAVTVNRATVETATAVVVKLVAEPPPSPLTKKVPIVYYPTRQTTKLRRG